MVVTPIRLYPLYCKLYCRTLTLTLTRWQPSVLVALSFAFVSDSVFKFYSVNCIGYNFYSTFSLAISLRNHQLFPKFSLSVGSKQRATTMLNFLNTLLVARIFIVVLRKFQPPADGHHATHILYQVILTLFVTLFLCVSHSSLHFDFLFCSQLATPSPIRPFFCPTVASNSCFS
jgi:hypothetical protein